MKVSVAAKAGDQSYETVMTVPTPIGVGEQPHSTANAVIVNAVNNLLNAIGGRQAVTELVVTVE